MPRVFIDTFDGRAVFDDEGYDLPDQEAVKQQVQELLIDMMKQEKADQFGARLRADVRDEAGKIIMTARLVMTIDEFSSEPV